MFFLQGKFDEYVLLFTLNRNVTSILIPPQLNVKDYA